MSEKGGRNRRMKETAMRKSVVTVLAAALAGATPAFAADETVSVTVPYADLDIADPAGAEALSDRIDSAAEKVCSRPDLRNLKAMVAFEECKAAAMADAMEQLSLVNPYADVALASRF